MTDGYLYIDWKKIDITPRHPVSMAGYFNSRVSKGVLDPLYSRLLGISDKKHSFLFIQIDTCLLGYEYAKSLRLKIASATSFTYDSIMVFASHIHTGPALEALFEAKEETEYKNWLEEQIISSAKSLSPEYKCTTTTIKTTYKNLASNRRWFMKDGRLLTNPPKGSGQLLKPEGPVDRELQAIVFNSPGLIPEVILVNISNHTDTIDGDMISADWPGFMERKVQRVLNSNIMVIPSIAPAGNINHFDFSSPHPQTSYAEAERIGNGYGNILVSALKKAEPLNVKEIFFTAGEITIPSREVDRAEIEGARSSVNKNANKIASSKNLTAEDLANEISEVKLIFQKELLKYVEARKEKYNIPVQALFFLPDKKGDKKARPVSVISIPGEPFVEIGLKLKRTRGYRMIVPISLANGYYGYIPLKKHFKHGGYEVLTTPFNCLSEKAGSILVKEYKKILKAGIKHKTIPG